jgi:hypothetical protein
MKKYNNIFIKYSANPNWPDSICHKDPNICNLTRVRTKKFELTQWIDAWKFIMECTSPITKLANILWAFPRKEAFDLLQSIDLLKEDIELVEAEDLDDYIGGDEIEYTLSILENQDKTYSELL